MRSTRQHTLGQLPGRLLGRLCSSYTSSGTLLWAFIQITARLSTSYVLSRLDMSSSSTSLMRLSRARVAAEESLSSSFHSHLPYSHTTLLLLFLSFIYFFLFFLLSFFLFFFLFLHFFLLISLHFLFFSSSLHISHAFFTKSSACWGTWSIRFIGTLCGGRRHLKSVKTRRRGIPARLSSP